jgi:putative Mn2+ efflux pump MntP
VTPGALLSLSVSLAADATTLAATQGMAAPVLRVRHVVTVGLLFGGFHGLMPLLGWTLSDGVLPLVSGWERWLAFAVMLGLGGRMVWAAVWSADTVVAPQTPLRFAQLLPVALVSSLDALGAGLALPAMNVGFATSLLSIAVTTAVLSGVGLLVGHRVGGLFSARYELGAGLVMMALGVKVVVG